MADYDSLPPQIRVWLADESENWDAAVVMAYWRWLRHDTEALLKLLEDEK